MFRFSLMIVLHVSLIGVGGTNGSWAAFAEAALLNHGDAGRLAADFLEKHHPQRDAEIDPAILNESIDYALKARTEFSWTRNLSDKRFLNDVLPYASLDETRELWREKLYHICKPMVANCKT